MPIKTSKTSKTKGPSAADKKTLKAAVKKAKAAAGGTKKIKGRKRKPKPTSFPSWEERRAIEERNEIEKQKTLMEHEHALALKFEAERNRGQFDLVERAIERFQSAANLIQSERDSGPGAYPFTLRLTGAELRKLYTDRIARIDALLAGPTTEPGTVGHDPVSPIDPLLLTEREGLAFIRDHLAAKDDDVLLLKHGNDAHAVQLLGPIHQRRQRPDFGAIPGDILGVSHGGYGGGRGGDA